MIHMTVVNYRTPEDLERFCASIEASPPLHPWSLTIYNVSPQPGDIAVGERYADRLGAGHCWIEENIGYGRACNEGACRAVWPEGERDDQGVLAFFNADVVLPPGAVDECVDALMGNPEWGVLGPRQVDDDGCITSAGIFGLQAAPILRGWKRPGRGGQFTDVSDEAVSVSGSAYFVRRSAWDHLRCCPIFKGIAPDARGAFLPTPHYYEETWVSYHARAHGWKVAYWGKTTVIHLWHRASPLGGHADQQMAVSRQLFRDACDRHGMPRD